MSCRDRPVVRYLGAETSLAGARAACLANPPDVLLLDLWLPDGDALTLAAELRRLRLPVRIIACTSRRDPVALHSYDALQLDGMLLKCGHLPVRLRAALDRVRDGGRYLSPGLASLHARMHADPAAYYKLLSTRQLGLLPWLGCGLADEVIAQHLAAQPVAVRSHRYRIMRTLGLNRLADLMRWAVRTGFVPPSLFSGGDGGSPHPPGGPEPVGKAPSSET